MQTWYVAASGIDRTLHLAWDPGSEAYVGALDQDPIDQVTWDGAAGQLEFRHNGDGSWEWYRVQVLDGVMVGRFAYSETSPDRPPPIAYSAHVTGWNEEAFGKDLVPRVFELLVSGEQRARLRIDRLAASGAYFGTYKVYSTVSQGALGEGLEHDIQVTTWDGANLEFATRDDDRTLRFSGAVSGRSLAGSFTSSDDPVPQRFKGVRAEVLSFGLNPLAPAELSSWQARVRKQLQRLMMAGAPAPLSSQVTTLAAHLPPRPSYQLPRDRDDAPEQWLQHYEISELRFEHTLPSPQGGAPLVRSAHAFLTQPTTPPPPGGYPVAVVVNGHYGSAHAMLDPDDEYYWYGESFARRGYVVLALDVGHRPVEDRGGLYLDLEVGDDPGFGNHPHPAIRAPGFDSDWEEDGERVWDVMRAIDYVQKLPMVSASRLLVTGLSMGGEVATLAGALDPRVAMTVAAGFSPDLGVMSYYYNHPCWMWQHADIREYVDVSDLHALVAPRGLLVQTGKVDDTFSGYKPPFASDKQVLRRSKIAYEQTRAQVVHYLHYDEHHYHVGDLNPSLSAELGVRVPALDRPSALAPTGWQTDARTVSEDASLYSNVTDFMRTVPPASPGT